MAPGLHFGHPWPKCNFVSTFFPDREFADLNGDGRFFQGDVSVGLIDVTVFVCGVDRHLHAVVGNGVFTVGRVWDQDGNIHSYMKGKR